MSKIKAVVFGYDDVLNVPEDWETWRADRDHLAARCQMTGEALWQHCFAGPAWRMAVHGQLTEAEFWMDRLLPLGLHTEEERRAFVADLFDGRMIHPVMRDLVERLHGRVLLAVLANIEVQDMATWLVDTHALEGFFAVVIGSADVGLAKPEPAIYDLLLRRLSCRPDDVLFIDNLRSYTAAAEALDMQTVLFQSPLSLASTLAARGVLTPAAPTLPVPVKEPLPGRPVAADRRAADAAPAWRGSDPHE